MEEYFTNLDFPWNSRISRNQLATNLGGPKTSCFQSRANFTRYIIIQNMTVDGLGIRRWLTHPFFGREVGSWNLPLIYDGFVEAPPSLRWLATLAGGISEPTINVPHLRAPKGSFRPAFCIRASQGETEAIRRG